MTRDSRARDSTRLFGRRRLVLPALALAVVVLAALVVWTVVGGGGDNGSTASGGSPDDASSGSPDPRRSSSAATPRKKATLSPGEKTASATPKVVPSGKPQRTLRTRLGRSRQLGNGVAVDVLKVENVRGKGRGIGEVSGPAVRLTVQVQNRTDRRLSLDLALITMYYGPQDNPASELSGPGVRRLPASLAPDGTATGTYVFGVPRGSREAVRVDFTYSTRAPRVVFRGAADGTA